MQKTGIILKSLAGFYEVEACITREMVTCRGRGLFRKNSFVLLVGDRVKFDLSDDGSGYITCAEDRVNQLVRPPIANVGKALVVFSAKEPDFNVKFLDRLLAVVEAKQIEAIILISKIDLLTLEEKAFLAPVLAYYRSIGYAVIETSSYEQVGFDQITALIDQEIVVVCGQSGVGKSSILNAIDAKLNIEVNAISKALGRGKHTTRHVELHKLAGGLVADTPGFSALDLDELDVEDLREAFVEFIPLQDHCKFRGCLHLNEPKCRVKASVESGDILTSRYENYVQLLGEIQNRKVKY
ncbi:MAG: ribosome small subunit-dependent GTPase A [Defluviitaleaceae bacterium]|nr:ribosome small subunit-dependent GTPase A [Defluviitaleaceae bacterium]